MIGGIIGVKLPRYRLFGDCVNTAARMVRFYFFALIAQASAGLPVPSSSMLEYGSRARMCVYCVVSTSHFSHPPFRVVQETSAPPGGIQLSQATADKLRASEAWPGAPKFELSERGAMKIKGKGEMVRRLAFPQK